MDLVQVAQHADDLDRAAAFYAALLGEPAVARFDPPGLLFFRLGPVRLLLEQAAPSALLYLQVDDLPAKVEELRAVGVTIEAEPQLIFSHTDDSLGPAGRDEHMALIRDSEGNLVGLVGHVAAAG